MLSQCEATPGITVASACATAEGSSGNSLEFLRVQVPANTLLYFSVVAKESTERSVDAAYTMRSRTSSLPGPGEGEFEDSAVSAGRTFKMVNCRYNGEVGYVSVQGNNDASSPTMFELTVAAEDATRLGLCPQMEWRAGPWGDWSHVCKSATRVRDAQCVRSDTGQQVDSNFCQSSLRPPLEETRDFGECVWTAYPWS